MSAWRVSFVFQLSGHTRRYNFHAFNLINIHFCFDAIIVGAFPFSFFITHNTQILHLAVKTIRAIIIVLVVIRLTLHSKPHLTIY